MHINNIIFKTQTNFRNQTRQETYQTNPTLERTPQNDCVTFCGDKITIIGNKKNVYDPKVENITIYKNNHPNAGSLDNETGEINFKDDFELESDDTQITERSVITNMTRAIKDKNGDIVAKEYARPSGVLGQYKIFQTVGNQKPKLIGLAETNPKNGIKHSEVNFDSFDGTKTSTVYAEKPNGERYSYYEIKDNNGKLLLKKSKQIKQISANHYITKTNGNVFDTEIKNDKMIITKVENGDVENEKVVFQIKKCDEFEKYVCDYADKFNLDFSSLNAKKFFEISKSALAENNVEKTIDKDLVNVAKKVSGDELFELGKKNVSILRSSNFNNAFSSPMLISIGENYKNSLSTLEHEIGHTKDFTRNYINKDKELNKIYNKEKKEFVKHFPKNACDRIDYFIDPLNIKELGNSICEGVAESNILFNNNQEEPEFQARTYLWQRFFPRTIAKVAELYDKQND